MSKRNKPAEHIELFKLVASDSFEGTIVSWACSKEQADAWVAKERARPSNISARAKVVSCWLSAPLVVEFLLKHTPCHDNG